MDKEKAIERIMALANSSYKRSKAALLEDVIDSVETAMAKGVPRAEIVKSLSESGLEMSINYFDMVLHRIRKKRKAIAESQRKPGKDSLSKTVETVSQPPEEAEGEHHEEITEYPAHDPRLITQILSSRVDLDELAKYAPKRKKP
jgi:hypothetical protein